MPSPQLGWSTGRTGRDRCMPDGAPLGPVSTTDLSGSTGEKGTKCVCRGSPWHWVNTSKWTALPQFLPGNGRPRGPSRGCRVWAEEVRHCLTVVSSRVNSVGERLPLRPPFWSMSSRAKFGWWFLFFFFLASFLSEIVLC